MATARIGPNNKPGDPPNKSLGQLLIISKTPRPKWPALSTQDRFTVNKMIRDSKKKTLGRRRKTNGFVTFEVLLIMIALGALAAFLVGCTNYGHSHKYPDGSEDKTSYSDFLKKTDAQALATKVKLTSTSTNHTYERSVGVDSFKTEGDKDLVGAVSAGATKGALEFMKNNAPGPKP